MHSAALDAFALRLEPIINPKMSDIAIIQQLSHALALPRLKRLAWIQSQATHIESEYDISDSA